MRSSYVWKTGRGRGMDAMDCAAMAMDSCRRGAPLAYVSAISASLNARWRGSPYR